MYPFIQIFGRMIPTYGLCMVIALIVGVLYAYFRCRGSKILIEDILILAACSMGFAVVGAKVVYIFATYGVSGILERIGNGDFAFLTDGGLVFLGGLLFSIPGALLGAHLAKHRLSEFEAIAVPVLPLGHAIGRVGCLLAGCCYGMEYEGIGAVHYEHSIAGLSPEQGYFPVQGVEALLNFLVFVILHILSKKKRAPYDLLFTYLLFYSIERFCLEFLRGDAIRGHVLGFSTSQWISMGMFAVCVVRMVVKAVRGREKD